MSRCFPFPPPGYEKKARTDDVNLLKKEKQKEKKHKKEKKDKEKRENKEKKEKDRSDGKHKDKKDKKEKHKDNKKEKDRDKEKEKDRSNNSEKKFPAHPDGQNGEQTSDEKKLPGKSEGQSGEKFIQKEKGRDKDRSSFSGEKKLAGQFSGYNGEKNGQNSHLPEDFRDSKFVQELGRRVRDEGAGAGKQLADKFMGTDWKRDEGMVRLVGNTANTLAEQKEKNKRSDDRKMDVQGIREETKSGGNAMVQNLAGAVKARVERIPRKVENNIKRQGEGKEKTEEKESDDKIKDKRKDRHRDKKSHGKHKDRDKEKEEKAKAKDEHRHLEQDNLKASNKDDPVGILDLKTSRPFREGNKGALAEENLHKRKDLETNGFFHVDDIKPNKLPRISSSHPLTDNGRTLETCQAPNPLTSDSQGAGNSHKVNNKDRKVNGIIEAKLLSVSPTKHLSASPQATQIDEVSIKPPHPDLKFLSQVLSVPKMEEWSDFDDQSWLFHSNESQSKKLKVGFSEIDESQVWAEALRIQSADVCALPYVIPY
ncbi:ankyrin repeat domain-containing protein 11-like [Durio zibethinus]|uniref:Ankyrin repeat domain-containing protein 11-like n=1 Tax=Durio zibethinus TaxID=66656 RepID=A0A6P6AAG3_DURZI|nr:ankyrin repeat domain-containing protein 11-like [Durio zibethinus]XP_022761860.1 ankyrin repeat domain-containing protein 11-like [Durio zibethinus]